MGKFNFGEKDVPATLEFTPQRVSIQLKSGESLTIQGEIYTVPAGYDLDCVVEVHGNLTPSGK